MLKNILNLEGAQKLTATEQKSISGGKRIAPQCSNDDDCGFNVFCCNQYCQFTPCGVVS